MHNMYVKQLFTPLGGKYFLIHNTVIAHLHGVCQAAVFTLLRPRTSSCPTFHSFFQLTSH